MLHSWYLLVGQVHHGDEHVEEDDDGNDVVDHIHDHGDVFGEGVVLVHRHGRQVHDAHHRPEQRDDAFHDRLELAVLVRTHHTCKETQPNHQSQTTYYSLIQSSIHCKPPSPKTQDEYQSRRRRRRNSSKFREGQPLLFAVPTPSNFFSM